MKFLFISFYIVSVFIPKTVLTQVDYDNLHFNQSTGLFEQKRENYTGKCISKLGNDNKGIELVMDVKDGVLYIYHVKLFHNNYLLSEFEYNSVNLKGFLKVYYPNGQIMNLTEYKSGEKEIEKEWYRTGELYWYQQYKNDQVKTATEYYLNGNEKWEKIYIENGKVIKAKWDSLGTFLSKDTCYVLHSIFGDGYGSKAYFSHKDKKFSMFLFNTDSVRSFVSLYYNKGIEAILYYDKTELLSIRWYSNGQMLSKAEIDYINQTGRYKEWRPGGSLEQNEKTNCLIQPDSCYPDDWVIFYKPDMSDTKWKNREEFLR